MSWAQLPLLFGMRSPNDLYQKTKRRTLEGEESGAS
jgi:hypothetical protein